MNRPVAGPLALWWRRSATRVGTAFGVVVVLTVWGLAIDAVAQFGHPAVASAATAARGGATPRGTEGDPVENLAQPTPYAGVPPTVDPTPAGNPTSPTGPGAGVSAGVPVLAALAAGNTTATTATPAATAAGAAAPAGTAAAAATATATTATTVTSTPEVIVDDNAVTAAARYGWGAATKIDTFDDPALPGWGRYDGPGHEGRGVRSPNALSAQNGVLTISGDAAGTTGGMAWGVGQKYGRWEGRMRAPVGDGAYHAVMLLWPDAENWPVGGEVDFAEVTDANRRSVDGFLHYGAANDQDSATVGIDATQWHAWAVEWNAAGITYFVDGRPWFQVTDPAKLPPGPMHLCLQLDWFPAGGAVTPTQMQVDDVAYYPVNGSGTVSTIPPGAGATVVPTPPTTPTTLTTGPVTTTVGAPTTPTTGPVTATTVPTRSPVTITTVPSRSPVTTTSTPTTTSRSSTAAPPTTAGPTTTHASPGTSTTPTSTTNSATSTTGTVTSTEPPTTTAAPRTATTTEAPASSTTTQSATLTPTEPSS